MARVPLIACGKELTMEFEAMPLVPAQTVRVRFTDAGPLPPPKHFSDREDATMATIEEELIRMMRESEKRQEELNTLYQEVERMRQFNRPLNRRESR